MKMLRCLVVLILLATLSLPAMAADDAVIAREGFDGFTDSVRTLCADGDLIWMYGDKAVHTYDASTGELISYPWNDETRSYLRGTALDADGLSVSADEVAWLNLDGSAHMIVQWFRYNESRTILESTGVTLEKVVLRDGQAGFERVRELNVGAVPLDDGYFPQIEASFAVNGTAVLFSGATVGPGQLYLLDPGADALRAVDVDVSVRYAIAWDDGILLIASDRQTSGQLRAGRISTDGGAPAEWTTLPAEFHFPTGFAQSGSELLFVDENALRAVNAESGARDIANVNVPISLEGDMGATATVTPSGFYIAGGYGGVLVRSLDRGDEPAATLTISYGGDLTNAILEYQNAHGSVNVHLVEEADNVLDALLSRSASWDILILDSHYDAQTLRAILNRGWALPIQNDAVRAFVQSALPGVSAQLIQSGEVCGFPLNVDCYVAGVNVGCLREMNLSIDDIPTSWPELLSYIQALIPTATVPLVNADDDADNLRMDFLKAILESYDLEIQAGAQSGYDSPELRAALEAFEQMDFDALNEQAQRVEAEFNAMFGLHRACGVPCDEKYLDEYQYIPLAISVSRDSVARLPLDCSVAILNPGSANADLANDFLETLLNQMDAATRATFSPSGAEPRLNESVYNTQTQQQDERIAQLEAALTTAEESAKQELQEKLDHERQIREKMEDWYWEISEESLERYRKNADGAMLNLPTGSDSELYALIAKSIEQNEGADALIRALQKALDMSRMEDA